jgi:DNA-binding NarL/FixJ family response regulator
MSQILLVDDATSLIELFAQAVATVLGHETTVVGSIAEVRQLFTPCAHPDSRRSSTQRRNSTAQVAPFDLAIVDLAFPAERDTGLSALWEIHHRSPRTALGILTQGDGMTEPILRDAWELLPIKIVLSKGSSLGFQISQIESVLNRGFAEVDPLLSMLLPAERNPWRTPHNFGRLVMHRGHAKLWQALLAIGEVPTYDEVAQHSGLSVNTIKNYRTQLLGELKLHGLNSLGLREMSEFARRCRPFLTPFLIDR